MAGALFFLFARTVVNRFRVRLRRLREPRYVIGSIAGFAYLYFLAFRHAFSGAGRNGVTPLAALERVTEPLVVAGAATLFAIVAAAWLLPGLGRPIEFTRPEVQFLFQAPVGRRQILHYKLLRGQLAPLVGTAIATLFLRPASVLRGWMFLVGLWLVLALVRLHLTGVEMRRLSLAEHGRTGFRRQWLPLSLVGASVAIVAGTVLMDWPMLVSMQTGPEVFRELQRLATSGPAGWVLWPFRWVARLPLAATPDAFLRSLPLALGLVALNYVWILRGDVAFEEASAMYAEQRATERRGRPAPRRNVKTTPFRLARTGRPEVAIVWKNLISMGRYASPRVFFPVLAGGLALVAVVARATDSPGIASTVVAFVLAALAMIVIIGPQSVRSDLRRDLASLAILKTWPVRGAAIVRGEVLAPALVLTAVTWLLIGVATIFVQVHGSAAFGAPGAVITRIVPLGVGMALIAPAVILAQLVLHNGMAILFPAWVTVGASRARGVDAMGQRLLMMAGVVLVLVLSLLPALVVAGLAGYALQLLWPADSPVVILSASIIATTVVLAECWIVIEGLGRVLDRTDVTAVDAAD
jgi:hypothetical protein